GRPLPVSQVATGPDTTRSSGNSQMRWWVLVLAAIAVSSSYYESDVVGPIADLLQRQRGFSQSQLGMLNGVLSIPNVALALINGLPIDRYGPARIALWSAAIGVLGAALTAVGSPYEIMVVGRFIFGVSEGAIFIALVAGLAQWFPRSGIALATALYLSLARVGYGLSMLLCVWWLWFCVCLSFCFCFLCFVLRLLPARRAPLVPRRVVFF